MTLSTTANKVVYQGNGATTVFPYSFIIPTGSSLVVSLVTNATGNSAVIAPINYTVTGLNTGSGTVTYPLSGPALSSLYTLVIQRTVPYVQATDFSNQAAVYPRDIEAALDYLTMEMQQLATLQSQSIVFSAADTVVNGIPIASARANLVLGFDSLGGPIAVAGIFNPSVTVSSAMIPVVTAASTAAALTALGIPGTLLDSLIPSGVEWAYHAGGSAPAGFVFPIGQACTPSYPDYRAKLIAASSPYGNNGTDPLFPDRRSTVYAVKSDMGGVTNGLLTGGTVLGAVLGSQSGVIATGNLPAYTPTGTVGNGAITVTSTPSLPYLISAALGSGFAAMGNAGSGTQWSISSSASQAASSFTGTAQGGLATPFTIVQPTFIANCILKAH